MGYMGRSGSCTTAATEDWVKFKVRVRVKIRVRVKVRVWIDYS